MPLVLHVQLRPKVGIKIIDTDAWQIQSVGISKYGDRGSCTSDRKVWFARLPALACLTLLLFHQSNLFLPTSTSTPPVLGRVHKAIPNFTARPGNTACNFRSEARRLS